MFKRNIEIAGGRRPRCAAATDSASVGTASAARSTRSSRPRGTAGSSANATITTATTRMACCAEVGDDYDYDDVESADVKVARHSYCNVIVQT